MARGASSRILFYVSGHGFGHARRMTQVIRELREMNPRCALYVRSAAPARIFEPLGPQFIEPCDIDAGLAERDPLTIDRDLSLRRLIAFMARREKIVADELSAVRRIGPDLIVADIPFLAADVAEQAETPSVGVSNFTWDWIYEHLFGGDERYAALAPMIAGAYAKMQALLELPFGRTCPSIRRKIEMPLIAMQSRRAPAEILRQLGISPDDRRRRVLIGTRGSIPGDTLANAAAGAEEFLFLCPRDSADALPANAIGFDLSPRLDFSDVTRIADIVVSKLGYGIVSESIATQCRLVWPAREGFAEDAISAAEAPRFAPMLEMSRADYYAGNWGESLRAAMNLPAPAETMRTDGARACAELILDQLV